MSPSQRAVFTTWRCLSGWSAVGVSPGSSKSLSPLESTPGTAGDPGLSMCWCESQSSGPCSLRRRRRSCRCLNECADLIGADRRFLRLPPARDHPERGPDRLRPPLNGVHSCRGGLRASGSSICPVDGHVQRGGRLVADPHDPAQMQPTPGRCRPAGPRRRRARGDAGHPACCSAHSRRYFNGGIVAACRVESVVWLAAMFVVAVSAAAGVSAASSGTRFRFLGDSGSGCCVTRGRSASGGVEPSSLAAARSSAHPGGRSEQVQRVQLVVGHRVEETAQLVARAHADRSAAGCGARFPSPSLGRQIVG